MINFEGTFILQNGLKGASQIIVEDQAVICGRYKSYPGEQTVVGLGLFLPFGWTGG